MPSEIPPSEIPPSEIPAAARRVTVAAERLGRWLGGVTERHGPLSWDLTDPVQARAGTPDGTRLWIAVPFPPFPRPLPVIGDADEAAAALVGHVLRDRRVGVLLVRRGGYAAGVFLGPRLVESKVGSSYVQGTTKAGGWSQQRFARRRANQARAAFGDAADVAVRVLLPDVRRLDAVVCGGDRAAVEATLADPRLEPLRGLVTGELLAVPDPRLRVLQETPARFRAVTIRIHP